jgi:hypothetical protein
MARSTVVRLMLVAVFVAKATSVAACSIGLNFDYNVSTEVLTVTASGAHADCRAAMYSWQIPALNMSGSGGCAAPCTVNETKTWNACLRSGSYTVSYYAQCGEDDPNGPASDHCKDVGTGTQTTTLVVQRPDPKVKPSVRRTANGDFEGWIEYEFPQTLSADRRNLVVRMLPKGKQPGGVIKDTFGESLAISGTYGPISLPPNRTFKVGLHIGAPTPLTRRRRHPGTARRTRCLVRYTELLEVGKPFRRNLQVQPGRQSISGRVRCM